MKAEEQLVNSDNFTLELLIVLLWKLFDSLGKKISNLIIWADTGRCYLRGTFYEKESTSKLKNSYMLAHLKDRAPLNNQ